MSSPEQTIESLVKVLEKKSGEKLTRQQLSRLESFVDQNYHDEYIGEVFIQAILNSESDTTQE